MIQAIDAHNGAVSAVATVFIAAFTVALVRVSRQQWRTFEKQSGILQKQVSLTQAQFDQWINLTNWRCVGKPQDNALKVRVDLVNPTNFPITVSGHIVVVGGEGWGISDEILFPNSPTEIEFKMSVAKDDWEIKSTVTANFTYSHRITKTLISQHWTGSLDCVPWKSDGQWHATFTQLSAKHIEKH